MNYGANTDFIVRWHQNGHLSSYECDTTILRPPMKHYYHCDMGM